MTERAKQAYTWVEPPYSHRSHAVINPRPLGVAALCGYRPAEGWVLGYQGPPSPKCGRCKDRLARLTE